MNGNASENLRYSVYYDASCHLCSTEINNLKQLDSANRLNLIDCSAHDFDDSSLRDQGVTRALMMDSMHVQDETGQWYRGVDAFGVLYGSVNLHEIATLWTHPWLRWFTSRLYPQIVRHRYVLSQLGMHHVVNLMFRFWLKRSHERSRGCHKGLCTIKATQEH
jgi:predicted DCC family thiol-disulfide oxidoreductase YuxK